MLRTGLKIFFILAAIAAIVVGYFYFFERNKNVPEPLDVFSHESLVVRVNQPEKLISGFQASDYTGKSQQIDSAVIDALEQIVLVNDQEKIKDVYVLFNASDTSISSLIVYENYSFRLARSVVDFFRTHYGKKQKVVEQVKDGRHFYSIYKNDAPHLYFGEEAGLVLMSRNRETLLSGLAQINKSATKKIKSKLYKTASKEVAANIFVNVNAFAKRFGGALLTTHDSAGLYAERMVLDMHLKQDELLLSGLSNPGKDRLGAFIAKAEQRTFSLPEIIPEGASVLYQIAANGLTKELFQRNNLLNDVLNWLDSWSDQEMVLFEAKGHHAIGLKAAGKSVAVNALENYKKSIDKNITGANYRFDRQTTFDIFSGDFNWIGSFIPAFFTGSPNFKYAAASGEYIVFTDNRTLLRDICNNTILQQNLKSSYQFKQHEPYLSSAANMVVYSKFSSQAISRYLSGNITEQLKKRDAFNMFDAMAWQMTGSGNNLYNHIIFFSNGGDLEKSNVRWKTKLKSSASLKPVVVKNHNNSVDEIFVQDEQNLIYLINRKGRILWQKQLDGPILSDVYQVDKYKNNKLQYLFNTASKIYLVDRNGNDVERFPVNLSTKASAGLAMFDYEKNENYRIFVPLEDKRLQLYDIDANIVAGWQFNKSDDVITTPVQHFRFDGKDYIVFADTVRHYILNRRGESRIKPSKMVGKSKRNKVYFDKYNARWVSTTTSGKVHYIDLSGDVETKELIGMDRDHYFLFADITRDGRSDYIFVDGKNLNVFDKSGKQLFKYTFKHRITEPPAFYVFSRHKAGIGIVDKKAGKVYMFNREGKQFKGYPYPGITPFTISHISGFSGFQLIVGNFDGFLYDYQLP